MSELKPAGKVFINMRKLVFDYNQKNDIRLNKEVMANFVIKNGSSTAKRAAFIRKTKEDSLYELTFTEVYNLCLFMDLSFDEFFSQYCKAI